MIGWHISVYTLKEQLRAVVDAKTLVDMLWVQRDAADSSYRERLAVWQTKADGLDWIEELVKAGRAAEGGDGYPSIFVARAEDLRYELVTGPPHANATWMRELGDVVGPGYVGKTSVKKAKIQACDDDEWLAVEAWDES